MITNTLIGLIIGGLAVLGGLTLGAISIIISVPWAYKEKLAKLEASNKERLTLIEKGVDPELLFRKKKTVGQDPLFWGFLLIGLGAGSLMGFIINRWTGWNVEAMSNGMAALLGGVAMVFYSFFRKRMDDKNPV